jgi:hypothetical protein
VKTTPIAEDKDFFESAVNFGGDIISRYWGLIPTFWIEIMLLLDVNTLYHPISS